MEISHHLQANKKLKRIIKFTIQNKIKMKSYPLMVQDLQKLKILKILKNPKMGQEDKETVGKKARF